MLLIVGVAAAAGGFAPSEEVSPPSSVEATDTTAPLTDTTAPVTDTTAGPDDAMAPELEDGDDADHPVNFGGTISSLRHDGDHTPAAVVKGKTVPGWIKKHPEATTTTTTEAPAQE